MASELERLVAAASPAPWTFYQVLAVHHGIVRTKEDAQLAALALDMARAGQALAEAIQHGHLGDQLDAMNTWAKLGKTKEGRGG